MARLEFAIAVALSFFVLAIGSVGCNLSSSDGSVENAEQDGGQSPSDVGVGDPDATVQSDADTEDFDADTDESDTGEPDPDTGEPDADTGEPSEPDASSEDAGDDVGEPECEPEELEYEPTQASPFMWSDVLVDGNTEQDVESNWVGKAAWSDRVDVRNTIADQVENGVVPYLFFFHWGDGPGTTMGEFQNATDAEIDDWIDFAEHIADGIGDGRAYVVLEPEWDANPDGANSSKFKDPLGEIIDYFRAEAPNALLINGPGMWQSDSVYQDFADIASDMDLQGFLHHVVSDDPDCTLREAGAYEGTHYEGGASFDHHVQIVDNVEDQAQRVQDLFNADEVILTDLAVTRCDWGDDGQEEILENLVNALPDLYDHSLLRGVALRDGGPAPEYRYMGHENEGQFNYSGHPAEAQVNQAPDIIGDHLADMSSDGDGFGIDDCVTGPLYEPELSIGEDVNDWWIEVFPGEDGDDVESLEVLFPDGEVMELPEEEWGAFADSPPEAVSAGTSLRLIARDGQMSAGTLPFSFQQEQPDVVPGWPAAFAVSENVNDWWIEVDVDNAEMVEVSINGGGFAELPLTEWGHFADSIYAEEGSQVIFRAWRDDGAIAYSSVYQWLEDD